MENSVKLKGPEQHFYSDVIFDELHLGEISLLKHLYGNFLVLMDF